MRTQMGGHGRGSEPYVEEDDDGWGTKARWVPPSRRPDSSKQELEVEVLQRNEQLTRDILNMKRITEQTKGVAGKTLVALHEQGEQIDRIHHKTVQTEQALEQGEGLLSKLGGVFSLGYKPHKGRRVTGPKDCAGDRKRGEDRGSRAKLGLDEARRDKAESRPNTEGLGAMQKHEAEKQFQDKILDDVISSLDDLKDMAGAMGDEIGSQNRKLNDLTADVIEVGDRVKQANKRADKLLGKR